MFSTGKSDFRLIFVEVICTRSIFESVRVAMTCIWWRFASVRVVLTSIGLNFAWVPVASINSNILFRQIWPLVATLQYQETATFCSEGLPTTGLPFYWSPHQFEWRRLALALFPYQFECCIRQLSAVFKGWLQCRRAACCIYQSSEVYSATRETRFVNIRFRHLIRS